MTPHCPTEPEFATAIRMVGEYASGVLGKWPMWRDDLPRSWSGAAVLSEPLPSPAERSRGRPFGVGHGPAWWSSVAALYGMARLGNCKPGGARRQHAKKSLARRGAETLPSFEGARFPSCVFTPCPFPREGNHKFPKRGMWLGVGVEEWWRFF